MLSQFGWFQLTIAEVLLQNYTLLVDSRIKLLSGLKNIDAMVSGWNKFMSKLQGG